MGHGARVGRSTVEATLTSKGQLTVPVSVRRAMGVTAGDKLRFAPVGDGFAVTPVKRGSVMDLDGAFASAKRVGPLNIHELRRRAARGRAKRLAAQR